MRDSILFFRSEAWIGNLSWTSSSWTSSLWDRDLRVFMTRTMAASICRAQAGEGLRAVEHSCKQNDLDQEACDIDKIETGCCMLVGRFKPGHCLDRRETIILLNPAGQSAIWMHLLSPCSHQPTTGMKPSVTCPLHAGIGPQNSTHFQTPGASLAAACLAVKAPCSLALVHLQNKLPLAAA